MYDLDVVEGKTVGWMCREVVDIYIYIYVLGLRRMMDFLVSVIWCC